LRTLHYIIQPRAPPALYPPEVSPSLSTATPSPASPAVIKDDVSTTFPDVTQALPDPSAPPSDLDLGALLTHLKSLADVVSKLASPPSSSQLPLPPAQCLSGHDDEPVSGSDDKLTPCLLATMSPEDIACLLHHPGMFFPSV
jgi:hypothetical protein